MSYRGLRDHSEQVFFPLFEQDDTGATFYIRVRGAPEQAIPSIRRAPSTTRSNRSRNTERMLAALSGSFGAVALLL
jgi:hypothetical protein